MKRLLSNIVVAIASLFLTLNLAAQNPQLVVQSGHQEAVFALAISPDKTLMASAGADKTIIIWDLVHAKQLYSLKKHTQWILSLAFSPNGRLLASGSADGTVLVWDVFKGVGVQSISVKPRGVRSVAFSPDGETLAISGNFSSIGLWDIKNDKHKAMLRGHTGAVDLIKFTADGSHLVSVSRDLTVRLWNLTTLETESSIKYADEYYGELSLAINSKGNLIIVGLDDKAFFWNLSGQSKTLAIPASKRLNLNGLALLDDRQLICDIDQEVKAWDLEANTIKTLIKTPRFRHVAIALSKDATLLAFSQDNCTSLLDISGNLVTTFKCGNERLNNVTFTPDGKALTAIGQSAYLFGTQARISVNEGYSMVAKMKGPHFAFLPSVGEMVAFGSKFSTADESQNNQEDKGRLYIRNLPYDPQSKPDRSIVAHTATIQAVSANEAGTILATSSSDGTIKLWDPTNWTSPKHTLAESATNVVLSPDGEFLVSAGNEKLKLWNTRTWENQIIASGAILQILISPDSKWVAAFVRNATPHAELKLWDVAAGRLRSSIMLDSFPADAKFDDIIRLLPFLRESLDELLRGVLTTFETFGSFSFNRDSTMLAYEHVDYVTGVHTVRVWDIEKEKEIKIFPGHSSTVTATAFSPNGKILASASWDTTVKLWSMDDGKELATIVPLDSTHWVIYTPDGRFDTNTDIEEEGLLHWSLPYNALNVLPLDVFMSDYWEPKLFERLLDCAERGSCPTDFKKLRNISELNIARPRVVIKEISKPDADRNVEVTLEVSRGSEAVELQSGEKVTRTTGIYDVRLFRDHQLIGVAPAEAAERLSTQHLESGNVELGKWRDVSEVQLDSPNAPRVLKFKTLLPQAKDATAVTFSAYAFNNDRVKSPTAKYIWPNAMKGALPPAQAKVARRAYIVSIGVSKSNLSKWNLNHGADDAYEFQKVLPKKMRQIGTYEVVPIQFVSDLKNGKPLNIATKENIKAIFDLLAGKKVTEALKKQLPGIRRLEAATPDDIVIITVSSHGYSSNNGDFYLLPSDVTQKQIDQDIPDLDSMISGEELAVWLRDINAGEIAIVIDACQSSAAVEGLAFKPGPLGSRGLGQLAYDKRMTVLAATQSNDDALEVDGTINQGLLSYVLAHEGFSIPDAAEDGKVRLKAWLKFGVERVPTAYVDAINQKLKGVVLKRKGKPVPLGEGLPSFIQQPSLFDFSRENGDIILGYFEPAQREAQSSN